MRTRYGRTTPWLPSVRHPNKPGADGGTEPLQTKAAKIFNYILIHLHSPKPTTVVSFIFEKLNIRTIHHVGQGSASEEEQVGI